MKQHELHERLWLLDVESWTSYFAVAIRKLTQPDIQFIFELYDFPEEQRDDLPLFRRWYREMMASSAGIVTWNGHNYDDIMIERAVLGLSSAAGLNALSRDIIASGKGKRKYWPSLKILSLDIAEFFPPYTGLKIVSAQAGHHRLEDLPIPWDASPSFADLPMIRRYNQDDNDRTSLIYWSDYVQQALSARCTLSEMYDDGVLPLRDAKLAERIVEREYIARTGDLPRRPTREVWECHGGDVLIPIQFERPKFQQVYEAIKGHHFHYDKKRSGKGGRGGKWKEAFELTIEDGRCEYQIGMGGLHGVGNISAARTNGEMEVRSYDFSSFYPSIIRQLKLAPDALDQEVFTELYSALIDLRLRAKEEGNTSIANAVKVPINALYGKFSDEYSWLLNPIAAITVTLNGQCLLLKLIEVIEAAGATCLVANTDGVDVLVPRRVSEQVDAAVEAISAKYSLPITCDRLDAILINNVNNVYRCFSDGSSKSKGIWFNSTRHLREIGGYAPIIPRALVAYLVEGIPMEETIMASDNLDDFIFLEQSSFPIRDGRAESDKRYPKIVRWYESNDFENGVTLFKHENHAIKRLKMMGRGIIVNNLPDQIPPDLNRQAYLHAAMERLKKYNKAHR